MPEYETNYRSITVAEHSQEVEEPLSALVLCAPDLGIRNNGWLLERDTNGRWKLKLWR